MQTPELGKKLIQLRNGRKREEVANACNISVSAMAMYESGKRIPRDEIKVKLAAFYGVTVGSLFYSDEVHES